MKNGETKIVLLYRLKGTEIEKKMIVEDDTYW